DVVVAQMEVPPAAVSAAFRAAQRSGALRILNPSPLPAGAALVEEADVLVVNEHEAAQLAGSSHRDPLTLAGLLAAGGRTAVVTLGAAGVVAAGPDGEVSVDGVDPVSLGLQVIDTTGAGDCFLGVLASGLAAGRGLREAIDLANR